MPRNSASDTFNQFLEDIDPMVNAPCVIKTGDVWRKLSSKYSYAYISDNFRMAMELMVEQGKAKKIRNGMWEILKVSKVA